MEMKPSETSMAVSLKKYESGNGTAAGKYFTSCTAVDNNCSR